MKQVLACLLLPVFMYATASAQTAKTNAKIDPVFLSLIARYNDSLVLHKRKRRVKPAVTRANVQTYECIVYTSDAGALRARKIPINSQLPKFVTTIVTLQQIIQMSLMEELSYIEAPKADRIH